MELDADAAETEYHRRTLDMIADLKQVLDATVDEPGKFSAFKEKSAK